MGPTKKTLYVIRHGETGSNVDGRIQDELEPLTTRGVNQAKALASKLSRECVDYPFTTLITSTDLRARQTAKIIGDEVGIAPTPSSLFVERRHPSIIRGKLITDPAAVVILETGRRHFHDAEFIYGDGETFSQMKERVLNGIDYILNLPDEHIGLVTHGVFKTFLIAATQRGLHLTSHDMNAYQCRSSNTGLSILNYRMRKDFSEMSFGWIIQQLNDTTHLKNC